MWDASRRHWEERIKHLPLVNHPWRQVVAWTKDREEPARYKPDLPMSIQDIEMECVIHGTELPRGHPTRRMFYRQYGFIVGASNGEETQFVYAEWHQNGAVHGRPITLAELHMKGKVDEAD
jgi:hypothetical protein